MKVFVKNMRGQALMPCSQRKARILLEQKKAKIVGYKPFTIQLTYAIAITGVESIKENPNDTFFVKQFRKKKRSLHEATPRKGRKTPNVTQKRNSKNTKESRGWYLNDEVICFGQRGWISGFTGSTAAYVTNRNGEYIHASNKNYKHVNLSGLKLISHNANWRYVVAFISPHDGRLLPIGS